MTHKFQDLMHTLRMLALMLMCALAVVSCGDSGDDNGDGGQGGSSATANSNQNSTADGTDRAVLRTEFPNIESKRNDYYIIVHRLSSTMNQYTDNNNKKHTFDSDGVNFCVVWDKNRKSQLCTCYQMHRGYNGTYNRVMGLQYPQDPDLPTQYRLDRDYISGSGFQHGHICPNVDRTFSHDANAQTNYMTNMQPQYAQFNGYDKNDNSHTGLWLKMENKVTGLAKNLAATDTLFICKGGTIQDGQVLRKVNGMIVPKYFFMAVLKKSGTGYHAFGFWTEHLSSYVPSNVDMKQYAMSIDELEKLTGIDFFCNLPDKVEDEVEKTFSPAYWGF